MYGMSRGQRRTSEGVQDSGSVRIPVAVGLQPHQLVRLSLSLMSHAL
jgi:hypothetical protein